MAARELGNALGNPLALKKAAVGTIATFSDTPSSDWLACNGGLFNASSYPELAAILGSLYSDHFSSWITNDVSATAASNHTLGVAKNNRILSVGLSGTTGRCFYSDDDGATFTYSNMMPGTSDSALILSNNGISEYVLMAGSTAYVRVSANNGQSYSTGSQPFSGSAISNLKISKTGTAIVLTSATGTSLARNTDATYSTWSLVSHGAGAVGSMGCLDTDHKGTWIIAATNTKFICRSVDDGNTWQYIPNAIPTYNPYAIVYCQDSVWRAYSYNDNGWHAASYDGGVTWESVVITGGSRNTYVTDYPMRFFVGPDGMVVCNSDTNPGAAQLGNFLISYDCGNSFSWGNAPGFDTTAKIRSAVISQRGTLVTVNSAGIIRSCQRVKVPRSAGLFKTPSLLSSTSNKFYIKAR